MISCSFHDQFLSDGPSVLPTVYLGPKVNTLVESKPPEIYHLIGVREESPKRATRRICRQRDGTKVSPLSILRSTYLPSHLPTYLLPTSPLTLPLHLPVSLFYCLCRTFCLTVPCLSTVPLTIRKRAKGSR